MTAPRLSVLAAAALAATLAAPAARAVALNEADLPAPGFSSLWSAPTAIASGYDRIEGTGAGGDFDTLAFSGMTPGAQTLSFLFEAPEAVDRSYSAGGAVLWSEDPFRWGWDGTRLSPDVQVEYDTGRGARGAGGDRMTRGAARVSLRPRPQTLTLDLPETFAGALFLALNFTHGADLAWSLTVPGNASATLLGPEFEASVSEPAAAVPLPAAGLLLGGALLGMGLLRRRARG